MQDTQDVCWLRKLKQSAHSHYSLWLWIMTESMEGDCAIQDPSSWSSCKGSTSEALGPCISSSGKMCPDDINTNSEKRNYSFQIAGLSVIPRWSGYWQHRPENHRNVWAFTQIDMLGYDVSLASLVDQIKCFGLQLLSISFKAQQQLVFL